MLKANYRLPLRVARTSSLPCPEGRHWVAVEGYISSPLAGHLERQGPGRSRTVLLGLPLSSHNYQRVQSSVARG